MRVASRATSSRGHDQKTANSRRGRRGGGRGRGLERTVKQLRGRLGRLGRRPSGRVGVGLITKDIVNLGDWGHSLEVPMK